MLYRYRNITEFNYRANNTEEAQVFVGISLKGGDTERHEILEQLKQQNYVVDDLSDDEVAKLHIRYLIGTMPIWMTKDCSVLSFRNVRVHYSPS